MLDHSIRLDLERHERLGFDEAIYSEGKSTAQLSALIGHSVETGARRLFTRLSDWQFGALLADQRSALDYDPVSRTAIFGARALAYEHPRVAIACAGSSDVGVGREAARTLEYYGHPSAWVADVGVAGLWRLVERLDELKDKDVVIVAAGMDGALPSVVGGLGARRCDRGADFGRLRHRRGRARSAVLCAGQLRSRCHGGQHR